MNDVLKTLIIDNSIKKWMEFQKLKEFYVGRDPFFDQTIDFIEKYFNEYNLFPNLTNFNKLLNLSGENELLTYVLRICNNDLEIYNKEEDFITALIISQKVLLEKDLLKVISDYQNDYYNMEKKDKSSIVESIDDLITKLYQVKQKVNDIKDGISSLVYGKEAVELIKDIYNTIKENKENKEAIYFDIDLKGMSEVQMKRGDFVVIGGYTSQGKSVWLRHILYKFLTKYSMNCTLFSFEMSHDTVLSFFHILHANNKAIFPNSPYISNQKFKLGLLTEEEEKFLNYAADDFANENKYGTLFIDQPTKSRYNLIDLQMKIKFIENTIMPVHLVGIDYLTQMCPIVQGRKSPDMEDYNQMIRDFKNYVLTELKIGITPTQISRKGFNEAIKNDGRYSLDAIRMYSEMEQSGDLVFTTLLTDAMRASSQLRIQNLKNRDGAIVIDPIDVSCDFDMGYSIGELETRSEDDIREALKNLDI